MLTGQMPPTEHQLPRHCHAGRQCSALSGCPGHRGASLQQIGKPEHCAEEEYLILEWLPHKQMINAWRDCAYLSSVDAVPGIFDGHLYAASYWPGKAAAANLTCLLKFDKQAGR